MSLFAQSPGTLPPDKVSSGGAANAESGTQPKNGLPVNGFLFLDESGTPVLMPAMSFEEIDRLKSLEAGIDSRSQGYSFQSLQITATATTTRAELQLTFRLTIEPADGRLVAVPLRMSNFHPLGPPEVSGLEDFRLSGSSGDGGHVLLVKANKRQQAVVKMNVSARVSSGPPRTIEFRLPDVPSQIEMTVDEPNVTGEIVGRGDEVIQVNESEKTSTRFSIESGGGKFSLRWGKLDRGSGGSSLLEIDNSRIIVQWDSPQDAPLVSCQMIVRSVRGTASELRIRLPKNAVLFGAPTLGTGGQEAQFVGPIASPDGDIFEVQIPKQDSQQRIDLNLKLQLTTNEPSGSSPLAFRVPEIIGALRQRGEIQVIIGDEYRLRWRSRPWVQSILSQSTEENGRSYFFRYDRAAFELPLWLATTHRQLRLSTEAEVSLLDSVARLEYRILPSGRASEGTMLKLELGDWRLRSIEHLETAERIEAFANPPYYEIFLESKNGDDPSPIQLVAEHDLAVSPLKTAFRLPRIVDLEESMLIQSSLVFLNNRGRSSLIVDLEASKNVDRALRTENTGLAESTTTRYRVIPADAGAELVGWIVEKSPRISLSGDATIGIDSGSLTTTLDWVLTSSLDLQGRLPIQIVSFPRQQTNLVEPTAFEQNSAESGPSEQTSAEQASAEPLTVVPPQDSSVLVPIAELPPIAELSTGNDDDANPFPAESGRSSWSVMVNNSPAVLQAEGGDRFVLISDQLSSGSMKLRWNSSRPLAFEASDSGFLIDRLEPIAIPRPVAVDMTYEGSIRVVLQGDTQTELLPLNSRANDFNGGVGESANVMLFNALPREPIVVRVRSRADNQENIFIDKAVLRTAVGEATRMEQLLAEVHGKGELRIGIPEGDYPISVEALLDLETVNVRRQEGALIVVLPPDADSHRLDLRIWVPLDASEIIGRVEPTLKLPMGIGRVFWELHLPSDRHVVWASPSLERTMAWVFDRLRLYREPTQSSQSLASWIGEGTLADVPQGNRYLYRGSDVRAFQTILISRTVLWIVTATIVLLLGILLSFAPRTRHPLTAVIAAMSFAGLLVIAPDAAVILGQLSLIALVLVVVMVAIRSLIQTSDPISALSQQRIRRSDVSMPPSNEGSSRRGSESLSATRSMQPSSRINKVSP